MEATGAGNLIVAVFCDTRKMLDTIDGHRAYHLANGAGKCAPLWADPDTVIVAPEFRVAVGQACPDCAHDGEDHGDDGCWSCSSDTPCERKGFPPDDPRGIRQ